MTQQATEQTLEFVKFQKGWWDVILNGQPVGDIMQDGPFYTVVIRGRRISGGTKFSQAKDAAYRYTIGQQAAK